MKDVLSFVIVIYCHFMSLCHLIISMTKTYIRLCTAKWGCTSKSTTFQVTLPRLIVLQYGICSTISISVVLSLCSFVLFYFLILSLGPRLATYLCHVTWSQFPVFLLSFFHFLFINTFLFFSCKNYQILLLHLFFPTIFSSTLSPPFPPPVQTE